MEQVKPYFDAFQKAQTEQERTAIIGSYTSFLETLSEADRKSARRFMRDLMRPSIHETVKELDALTEKAELILSKKGKLALNHWYSSPILL